jgi:branched-chain amino acid transport system permease protein
VLKKLNYIHWALIAFALICVVVIFIDDKYILDIIFMTFFWAAIAGAWNISGGYAGQFSLGHAAFVGIGAYTTALLFINFHISPWIGMLVGGILAIGLALLIGVLCFKVRGPFYTLITIAFAQLVYICSVQLREITGGSEGLSIPFEPGFANLMFRDRSIYVIIALVLVLIIYLLSATLERSKLGYYLVAMRENEDAALALGISTKKVKIIATSLSSFLTSVCGSLYAMYILFIEPNSVLSFTFSIQPAMISIIGGLGTALGPIIGSVLLTPLEMILRETFTQINGLNLIIYGVLLVIVMLFWSDGIVNNVKKLKLKPLSGRTWARKGKDVRDNA